MHRFLLVSIAVGLLAMFSQQNAGAGQLPNKNLVVTAACAAPAPQCCDPVCIDYRYRRPCRKVCCECGPPQKLTLCVQDPCCCDCTVKVPVCIPSCCQGQPIVCDRCGLFGKGVVTYKWCCGFKLTVTLKKCGDVVVTYFGA